MNLWCYAKLTSSWWNATGSRTKADGMMATRATNLPNSLYPARRGALLLSRNRAKRMTKSKKISAQAPRMPIFARDDNSALSAMSLNHRIGWVHCDSQSDAVLRRNSVAVGRGIGRCCVWRLGRGSGDWRRGVIAQARFC